LRRGFAEFATNFNGFCRHYGVKRAFEKCRAVGQACRPGVQELCMWRDFTKVLREVWRLSAPDGGAYRPDLHYMRGPGPKWRAKYGSLYPRAPAPAAERGASLRDLAQNRA
jgi:hypothetical protein